jgi:serine/threonine-protein kinase
VEVSEVGVDDGRPFVVMERLVGEDLRARLARGPMPWPEALAVALGAARGLAVAHEHGIVHRDLKPANLFLTRDGVKLLDFGSAKVLGGALEGRPDDVRTAPRDLVGSPRYMSPEQARGRTTLDPRTDVFSLGLVLYEALVGVHPYDEVVGLSNLILALCTEPPLPLAMAASHVPPSFAHVVERALAIDPGTRPADGGALLAELERVADALPDTPTALPPATTA